MQQLSFLDEPIEQPAKSSINRIGSRLELPEGLATIDFTHGIHRFPGKFVPQIPQYIFRHFLKPGTDVLDPFCGSATTVVEAILDGRNCYGWDIDPLALLVAKVKTTPLTSSELLQFKSLISSVSWDRSDQRIIPNVPNLDHWFSAQATAELSALKSQCTNIKNARLRQFALVVFSSVIRRVSNADDQTQKTYVSHTKIKNPPLPRDLFPIMANRAVDKMSAFSAKVSAGATSNIEMHDARNTHDALPRRPPQRVPESVVAPTVYRDDYGRVITEAGWNELQKRKAKAANSGYVIDEFSQ